MDIKNSQRSGVYGIEHMMLRIFRSTRVYHKTEYSCEVVQCAVVTSCTWKGRENRWFPERKEPAVCYAMRPRVLCS